MKQFIKVLALLLALPFGAAYAQTTNVQGTPNITVQDCPNLTVASGGTAVQAIPASKLVRGYIILNLDTTEALWMQTTGRSAVVGGGNNSAPLAPGAATSFAGAGSFSSPLGMGPNAGVSVNATTSSHAFFCIYW